MEAETESVAETQPEAECDALAEVQNEIVGDDETVPDTVTRILLDADEDTDGVTVVVTEGDLDVEDSIELDGEPDVEGEETSERDTLLDPDVDGELAGEREGLPDPLIEWDTAALRDRENDVVLVTVPPRDAVTDGDRDSRRDAVCDTEPVKVLDMELEGDPTSADHVCVLLRVIESSAETEIVDVTVFVNDGELALETDAEYVALTETESL